MPGQLKPRAYCPCCGEPLDALVDETSYRMNGDVTVKRVYYHGKVKGNLRRRRTRPCRKVFEDHAVAVIERKRLEV